MARMRRIARLTRAGFGMLLGVRHYPKAWLGSLRPRDPLAKAVGELLLVGFAGASVASPAARLLARQVQRGQVGAVVFITQNIGTRAQLTELLTLFRQTGAKPLLMIDHEGGNVQRLKDHHGFTKVPAARNVAHSKTPEEARDLYAQAGAELADIGFNVNLGPVLDVFDPENPAIGKPGRSYGTDPQRIAAFGEAFVEGHRSANIICAAKHFPGHGRAVGDSHDVPADISATWSKAELEPFAQLLASAYPPDMIMVGHVKLDTVDPSGAPATLSGPIVTGLLRERLGFEGVVVTDDIDMGAIRKVQNREEAFVQALAAGNDLIMVLNLVGYDPLMPERAVDWVRVAIKAGTLSEAQVMASAARVRAIRRRAYQDNA